MSPAPISEIQLAANRENSKLSTGPRSAEGKSRTRLNGLRHGLTGQTAFLPEEDRVAYDRHHAEFHAHYKPQGFIEIQLAHQIADDYWRLNRLKAIETNIFAIGIDAHASQFDHDALSQAQTFLDHSREINLLSVYEQRLNRAIEYRHKRLLLAREIRKDEERALAFRRRNGLIPAEPEPQTFTTVAAPRTQPGNGFAFSNPSAALPADIEDAGETNETEQANETEQPEITSEAEQAGAPPPVIANGFAFSNYVDPGTGFPARVYPPRPNCWEKAARAGAAQGASEIPSLADAA